MMDSFTGAHGPQIIPHGRSPRVGGPRTKSRKSGRNIKKQFAKWGIYYDEIRFGKPAADLYIDDKAAVPSILNALVNQKFH